MAKKKENIRGGGPRHTKEIIGKDREHQNEGTTDNKKLTIPQNGLSKPLQEDSQGRPLTRLENVTLETYILSTTLEETSAPCPR